MKKIRLTEDDLKRIVSSVLVEAKHVLDNDDYNDIYFRLIFVFPESSSIGLFKKRIIAF
jgi:hypothetical protein